MDGWGREEMEADTRPFKVAMAAPGGHLRTFKHFLRLTLNLRALHSKGRFHPARCVHVQFESQ